MALCGRLEAKLNATAATRGLLLAALLAEALAPAERELGRQTDGPARNHRGICRSAARENDPVAMGGAWAYQERQPINDTY
jgi:hypothetical protein